ncbi:MAG: hypothetical protein P1V20_25660 [Verrucomicrobiales bacterium]|nr:hypothetical protein [Verrucomicrobiales bacterium]
MASYSIEKKREVAAQRAVDRAMEIWGRETTPLIRARLLGPSGCLNHEAYTSLLDPGTIEMFSNLISQQPDGPQKAWMEQRFAAHKRHLYFYLLFADDLNIETKARIEHFIRSLPNETLLLTAAANALSRCPPPFDSTVILILEGAAITAREIDHLAENFAFIPRGIVDRYFPKVYQSDPKSRLFGALLSLGSASEWEFWIENADSSTAFSDALKAGSANLLAPQIKSYCLAAKNLESWHWTILRRLAWDKDDSIPTCIEIALSDVDVKVRHAAISSLANHYAGWRPKGRVTTPPHVPKSKKLFEQFKSDPYSYTALNAKKGLEALEKLGVE